ncbi:MAG TPA: hypothetical protein VMH83_14125 [Candidatus Acidoferrum sp.]|nr:hypothetical protein [Candidatus Acidoferrum sp.]
MEFDFDNVFYAIIAIVVVSFVYKIVRYGGFKAAMFGASIKRTIGEVSDSGSRFGRLTLKVHELEDSKGEKAVGLELVAKTIGSYSMTPVTLDRTEVKNLIDLLNRAISSK